MRHKPQPAYTKLNPTPRSMKNNGKHRRSGKTAHGNPADGAGSTVIRTGLPASAWRTLNFASSPVESFRTPEVPHAGIRAGELIGHRAWFVINDHELRSLAHHFVWEPAATIEGKINEQVSPWMFNLMGGVYSHFSREATIADVDDEFEELFPKKIPRIPSDSWNSMYALVMGTYEVDTFLGLVIGTIKMWGEVVEHERGYRAQYAKLVSLDQAFGVVDLAKLKEKYDV